MRILAIFCFTLVICSTFAEDTTDSSNTTTVEPTNPPTTSTTLPPITPSTVPPPAPTEPTPTVDTYAFNGTSSVCILAKFAAQFLITYENTANVSQTATLNVANATVDTTSSTCGQNASQLSLTFGDKKDKLSLIFTNTNGEKYVESIVLDYVPNKDIFPGHPELGKTLHTTFGNLTLFKIAGNQSYTCSGEEAKNAEATAKFSGIQVEAFRTSNNEVFSQAQDCVAQKVSDLVPIAVGCALLALVLIVLIAYFIGRRRSRRLAYQSV